MTVLLHAAGSLRDALTDIAEAFAASGVTVQAKYGPSGTLRDEIAGGASAEVFASANMAHPESLSATGKSGPVVRFARNRLCALVRPGLGATPENLLDRMRADGVRLATSTPKADPSGDYAFEVFARAEALIAGSRTLLETKALRLTGAPTSAQPPAGRNAYGWHVTQGRADIFLTYQTNAAAAQRENPSLEIVTLPDPLAVGADYGLTVMNDAPAAAYRFVLFILSTEGQRIPVAHGFAPGLRQPGSTPNVIIEQSQETVMLDWQSCAAVERIPGKVSGEWLFKGTRVPVKALFENLEGGARVDDFLEWFPGVTREQVEMVLRHAERSLVGA